MRPCKQYENLIPLMISGDLAAAEMTAIRAHLELCPACCEYTGQIGRIQSMLAVDRVEVPVAYASDLVVRINARIAARGKRARRRLWSVPALASLAAVVLIAFSILHDADSGAGNFLAELEGTATFAEMTNTGYFSDPLYLNGESSDVGNLEEARDELQAEALKFVLDEPVLPGMDDYILATQGLDESEFDQLIEQMKKEVI